jgi:hypothetical protein
MITLRNSITVEILDFINGKLEEGSSVPTRVSVYNGPRPTYPEIAHTAQLLCTFELPGDFFGGASSVTGGAVATVNVDDLVEPDILATNEAQWFRVYNQDGVAVLDGSVTATGGGGDMQLQQTGLILGRKAKMTAWVARYPQ